MIRWGLLGGTWPESTWELFVTLGGALVGAGVLFFFLFPLWSTYPIVGVVELAIFLTAGAVLLLVGVRRRARSSKPH